MFFYETASFLTLFNGIKEMTSLLNGIKRGALLNRR